MVRRGSLGPFGTLDLHKKLCYGQVIYLLAEVAENPAHTGYVSVASHHEPQVRVQKRSCGRGLPSDLLRSRFLVCPEFDYKELQTYALDLERVGRREGLDAGVQSLLLDNLATPLQYASRPDSSMQCGVVLAHAPLTPSASARADRIADALQEHHSACLSEVRYNQQRVHERTGEPVTYTNKIQLQDVLSGKYLSVQRVPGASERPQYEVTLLEGGDEGSRFVVRSDDLSGAAGAVDLGKSIRLESGRYQDAHLFWVSEHRLPMNDEDRHSSTQCHELVVSEHSSSPFTVVVDSFLPASEDERAARSKLLHGFQCVYIAHKPDASPAATNDKVLSVSDLQSRVVPEREHGEGDDDHEPLLTWAKLEGDVWALCGWRIQCVNHREDDLTGLGMPVTSQTRFRLVHVISGLYLCASNGAQTGKVSVTKDHDDPGCLFSFAHGGKEAGSAFVTQGRASYIVSTFGTWLSVGSRQEVEQVQRRQVENEFVLELIDNNIIAALLTIGDCSSALRAFNHGCHEANAAKPIDRLKVSLVHPERNPSVKELNDVAMADGQPLMETLRQSWGALVRLLTSLVHLMSQSHSPRGASDAICQSVSASLVWMALGRTDLLDSSCDALDTFPFTWFMLRGVGHDQDRSNALNLSAYLHEFLRVACSAHAANWPRPCDRHIAAARQHVGGALRAAETVHALSRRGAGPAGADAHGSTADAIELAVASIKKMKRHLKPLLILRQMCGSDANRIQTISSCRLRSHALQAPTRPNPHTQILIAKALLNSAQRTLVRVDAGVNGSPVLVQLSFWNTESPVASCDCAGLQRGVSDDVLAHQYGARSDMLFARERELFNYFIELLDLYRAICSFRNERVRQLLQEASKELSLGIERDTLLSMMRASALPFALRCAATRLLAVLYLDAAPNYAIRLTHRKPLLWPELQLKATGKSLEEEGSMMPEDVLEALLHVVNDGLSPHQQGYTVVEYQFHQEQQLHHSIDILLFLLQSGALQTDDRGIAKVLRSFHVLLTRPEWATRFILKGEISRLLLTALEVWVDTVVERVFACFATLDLASPDSCRLSGPPPATLPAGKPKLRNKVVAEELLGLNRSPLHRAAKDFGDTFQQSLIAESASAKHGHLQSFTEDDDLEIALLQSIVYGYDDTCPVELLLRLANERERLVGAFFNAWLVDKGTSRRLFCHARRLFAEVAVQASFLYDSTTAKAEAADAVTTRVLEMTTMLTSMKQVNLGAAGDADAVTITRAMALDFQRIYVELGAHELAFSIIKLPLLESCEGEKEQTDLLSSSHSMFQACWRFLAALCRVDTTHERATDSMATGPMQLTNEHNQRLLFKHLGLIPRLSGPEGVAIAEMISAMLWNNEVLAQQARESLLPTVVEVLTQESVDCRAHWLQLLSDVVWNEGKILTLNATAVLCLLDLHRSEGLHLLDVASDNEYDHRVQLMQCPDFVLPSEGHGSAPASRKSAMLKSHRCSLQLIADCCRSEQVAASVNAAALVPFESCLIALLRCYREDIDPRKSRYVASAYWSCLQHVHFAVITEEAVATVRTPASRIFDVQGSAEALQGDSGSTDRLKAHRAAVPIAEADEDELSASELLLVAPAARLRADDRAVDAELEAALRGDDNGADCVSKAPLLRESSAQNVSRGSGSVHAAGKPVDRSLGVSSSRPTSARATPLAPAIADPPVESAAIISAPLSCTDASKTVGSSSEWSCQRQGTASSLVGLLASELQVALSEAPAAWTDPYSATSTLLQSALPCLMAYLEHHYKQHISMLTSDCEVQLHALADTVVSLHQKLREHIMGLQHVPGAWTRKAKLLYQVVKMFQECAGSTVKVAPIFPPEGAGASCADGTQSTSGGVPERGRDIKSLWTEFVKLVVAQLDAIAGDNTSSTQKHATPVRQDVVDADGQPVEDASLFGVVRTLTQPWHTSVPDPTGSGATLVGRHTDSAFVNLFRYGRHTESALLCLVTRLLRHSSPPGEVYWCQSNDTWPEDVQQRILHVVHACMHVDDGTASVAQWDAGWARLLRQEPPSLEDGKRDVTKWMQDKYIDVTGICVNMIARHSKATHLDGIRVLITLLEGGNRNIQQSLHNLLLKPPQGSVSEAFFAALTDIVTGAKTLWGVNMRTDSAIGMSSLGYRGIKRELEHRDCPVTAMTTVFHYLQLLVEGDYFAFKEILGDRPDFLSPAVDVLSVAVNYLTRKPPLHYSDDCLTEAERVVRLVDQLLAFMSDMVQGSAHSHRLVMHAELSRILKDMFALTAPGSKACEGQNTSRDTESWRFVIRERCHFLLIDLLQGEAGKSDVCQSLLAKLDWDTFQTQLADLLNYVDGFKQPLKGSGLLSDRQALAAPGSETQKRMVYQLDLMLQLFVTMGYKAAELSEMEAGSTKMNPVIKRWVSRTRDEELRAGGRGSGLGVSRAESSAVAWWTRAISGARERLYSMEVLWKGRLQRVSLLLHPDLYHFKSSSLASEIGDIMKQAAPRTRNIPFAKAHDLLEAMEQAAKHLDDKLHFQQHEVPMHSWSPQNASKLHKVAILLGLSSVMVLCLFYGRSFQQFRSERPLAYTLVILLNGASCAILAMRTFACFAREWFPWHHANRSALEESLTRWRRVVSQQETASGDALARPPVLEERSQLVQLALPVVSILCYRSTLPLLFVLVFNLLSLIFSPFFIAANFVLVFTDSGTGQMLFEALAEAGWGIVRTCWLAVVTLLMFALGSYAWFQSIASDGEEGGRAICHTLYQCIGMHFVAGIQGTIELVFDSNAGVDLVPSTYSEAHHSQLLAFWILLFFMVWNFILSNIFIGQIVDAFSATRELKESIEEDNENKCLLCSFDRETFQRESDTDYAHHIREEHNVLNYVCFLYRLRKLKREDYTELDTYVSQKLELEGFDRASWLPVQSALALESAQRRQELESAVARKRFDDLHESHQRIREQNELLQKQVAIMANQLERIHDKLNPADYAESALTTL